MLRKAPPLEAIEVFAIAARSGSFRAVARELALSPSAVSRRIAGLEGFLGCELFDRSGPTPRLNAAGRRYLAAVAPAIAAIRDATEALETDAGPLRIAASHSFASTWLMRRLPRLAADHGIEAEVMLTRDPEALHSGDAHLAVWGLLEAPEGLECEPLFLSRAAPVSAAQLADGRPAPRSARELAERVLLDVSVPGASWRRWFAASGVAVEPGALKVRDYPTQQLAYEAAAAGLGVTLATPLISEPYVPSRGLSACGEARPVGSVYRLCRSARRRRWSPRERRFIAWLKGETDASVSRFDAALGLPALGATPPAAGQDGLRC